MSNQLTKNQILAIQRALHCNGTGEMDMLTRAAIHNFQQRNPESKNARSWGEIYKFIIPNEDESITSIVNEVLTDSSDINQTPSSTLDIDDDSNLDADLNASHVMSLDINTYMMDPHNYVTDMGEMPSKREFVFLHHTAGWNNPYHTVDFWKNDVRGRIGTHFVIGGTNIRNYDRLYDGKVVQCIPDKWFAWHLGIGNTKMHRESIGIELCNFGYLEERGSGFFTIYGHRITDEDMVIELDQPFRGQKYWHKYTEEQIENLHFLLKYCEKHFGTNIKMGIPERLNNGVHSNKAFGYDRDVRSGEYCGVFSHTNVIPENSSNPKWDVSPQPLLVEMLKSL